MSENVYYHPESSGLVLLDQLDEPNLSYEYNKLIALQHTESGRCYYAQDSGCSCPTPFENFFFRGPDDTNLDEVQLHNFSSFEAEVKSFATGSYRDENGIAQHERDKMLDTVKAALKKAKVTMAKYLTCCGCDEVNFYHSAVCCNARAGLQSHNPLGGLQPNSYVRSSTFPSIDNLLDPNGGCADPFSTVSHDWLVDLANTEVEYIMALKELWRVTKASWNMGYSPEFTKAYQRLMELDRQNEKKTE